MSIDSSQTESPAPAVLRTATTSQMAELSGHSDFTPITVQADTDQLPQPETADQRRERLAREIDPPAFDQDEVVDLRDGRQARALAAADRIIVSDRAAGCDPEAPRQQVADLTDRMGDDIAVLRREIAEDEGVIAVWRGRTQRAEAERDALNRTLRHQEALRREIERCEQAAGRALGYPRFCDDRKNFPSATGTDGVCIGDHVAGTIVEELAGKYAEARAEIERLKITIHGLEAGERLELFTAKSERDALAARLAVAVRALEISKGEAFRSSGNTTHLKRCVAVQLSAALTDLPARAAAMLRVVEAADAWDLARSRGASDLAQAGDVLIDAIRRHRQETDRDTFGRAIDGDEQK